MKKIFIGSGSGSEHKICAYQSTKIFNFFEKNGHSLQKSPIGADFIVLNGYPFEELEEKINLLTIGFYLQKYPNSKILLIGSIPGMMRQLEGIDRITMVGWGELERMDKLFTHSISIKNIKVDAVKYFIPLNIETLNLEHYGYKNLNTESKYVFSNKDLNFSVFDLNKNYDFEGIGEYDYEKYNYLEDKSGEYPIEICTGCGGYCSYCDIRNVSGFVKSVPIEKILEKINRALSLGYKKIHFIDEDSASYGLDIGIDFADLLNKIAEIKKDFILRIFYFEPGRLQRLYNKINPKVWQKINHFCVPLQTTSSRILKLMNRHYDINKVLKIIKEIKNENPKIEISTQFIYGFPTETFEEFKDYFRMLSVFDMLWFWYYSPRRGTKAVDIEGKIPKEELIMRLKFLWKFKERFLTRIFDKNESLEIGINTINFREF